MDAECQVIFGVTVPGKHVLGQKFRIRIAALCHRIASRETTGGWLDRSGVENQNSGLGELPSAAAVIRGVTKSGAHWIWVSGVCGNINLDMLVNTGASRSFVSENSWWSMILDTHISIFLSVFPYMQRTFGSRGRVVFDTGHLYQYFFYMRLSSVFAHICK